MQAQAILFREANRPRLETLTLPDSLPGDLVVKMHYSGISIGTEKSIFSGARTHNGTFPMITGYQASGIVEQVGADVNGFAVGDSVVAFGARLEGDVKSIWGAHLSRQVVDASQCHKIPTGVKLQDAAMFILPSVSLNAINMVGIKADDTVLIQGQGLIGQLFGQFARGLGAKVIVIEPSKRRAELARQYVTPHVLIPSQSSADDPLPQVRDLCDGRGPSVVVEATGSKALIAQASRYLTGGAKFVFLAWYAGDVPLNFHAFHANQVTAFFPHGFGGDEVIRAVLDALAAKRVVLGENITDVVPFTRGCEGFGRIIANDPSVMGMVIDWREAE